jgi:glycerophosphoryl diester phosphodiesterase
MEVRQHQEEATAHLSSQVRFRELALTAAVLAYPGPLYAQPDCPRGTLPAYAHNDYANRRPLLDALSLGYQGVEADVVLIDGELRLGHDRRAARRGATFEVQYLAPLGSLVARCGTLTTDGRPFLLTVDLKEASRPAYDALVALLTRYGTLITPRSAQASDERRGAPAVEIVLVGWHPTTPSPDRSIPLGRHEALRSPDERALEISDPAVRLVSLDYGKTVGRWWVTGAGRRRWLATLRATKATFPALRIRAHNVPVDPRVYRELFAAGVDLIGTKDLGPTARLLDTWARPSKDPGTTGVMSR